MVSNVLILFACFWIKGGNFAELSCPDINSCLCKNTNKTNIENFEVMCNGGGLTDKTLAKLISKIPKNIVVIKLDAPSNNPNNFSLTQDFARFSKLTELHLTNGTLSALGKRMFENFRNLKILNLSGNQIDYLTPETFGNMERLEHLSLARNLLNRTGQRLPTGTFVYLRNLQSLDLAGNFITDYPSNLFYGLQYLKILNLNSNSFTQSNFDLLYDLPSLQEFHLKNCSLINIPARAFSNNLQLRYLNLANNRLNSTKILAPKLEILNLAYNRLKLITTSAFAGVPNLKSLNLAGNFLGVADNAGLRQIFQKGAFDDLVNLEELNLADNKFKYFDSSYVNLKSLKSLDLSSNPFITISACLINNLPNLRALSLSDINLSVLDDSLPMAYSKIKTLDLSKNHLNAVHYDTLQYLESLEILDISSNNFVMLPNYVVAFFKTLKLIQLHNNPWDCQNCQIGILQEFLLSDKWRGLCEVMHYEQIMCAQPSSLVGQPVALLDEKSHVECSKRYGAASLSKSSEMGLLIAGVCGILLLLGLVTAVACSYFWPRATYRTNEEKANLSVSVSEHSNLQPAIVDAAAAKEQQQQLIVERLF